MAVRIGLIGAAGRMGVALAEAIEAQDGVVLAGAIERAGHERVGQPILPGSGVLIRDDAAAVAAECDVLIDFSAPVALASSIALGRPLVVGTTGLEASHHAAIDTAAQGQPVLP
ncbi:MAG TPA: 4-hydroxy-tetrahydrodipicolinate reductase, partial [Pedomonas sp.]